MKVSKDGIYKKSIKRPMDFILSLVALVVLSPVFLVVAILVRVKLGSPIIFKQNRPGLDEEIFTMYKFRTMTNETEENGDLKPDKIRLTQFGKFLRSTSLDELPELWNIVKGDMSIVGPRPLHVKYLKRYNKEQKLRHNTRPGLSGLAQINGRNTVSWDEKFKWDVRYITNITFLNDWKIILKTIIHVFKREGVQAEENVTMPEFKGTEQNRQL